MSTPQTIENYIEDNAIFLLPRTETEYQACLDKLSALWIEAETAAPDAPVFRLLETLEALIESYEASHFPIPDAPAHQILAFLLAQHDLKQSDLPEIGSQGVVSELLSGKRQLNTRQVKALCDRFHVSADVFI